MELTLNKGEMLWIARNEETGAFFPFVSPNYEKVRQQLCTNFKDSRLQDDWRGLMAGPERMANKWFPVLISEGWDIVKIDSIHTLEAISTANQKEN